MPPVSRFLVAVLLVTGAALPAADGPQETRRPVYLEGRVVDAGTNEPLRGVVVLANGVQGSTTNVAAAFLTGPDGRFVFRDLAGGTIGLRATKTGFLPAEIKPFEAGPGIRREDLRLALKPESTISGRVVDQFGEPVAAASVKAVQLAAVPPSEPSNLLPGTTARTDDAGRYVIGKLDKDLYLVFVEGSATRATPAHDPVFFPDSLTADRATVIDLEAGTERAGVDMMVTARLAPPPSSSINKPPFNDNNQASVSGMVRDQDGRGVSYVTVGLRTPGFVNVLRTATTDESGRFEMDRLPRGRFELVATRDPSNFDGRAGPNVSSSATIELAVDQRLTDVALKFTRGGTVAGRLRDQFGDPTEGILALRPATGVSGAGYSTRTNARGEFLFADVLPEDYVLMVMIDERPFGRELRVSINADTERTMAFLPFYYPGVADESLATPITVAAGGELPALDVEVRPEPATTIEINVDPAGRSVANVQVYRIALGRASSQISAATSVSDGSHALLYGASAGRHRVLVSAREKTENAHERILAASTDVLSDGATPSVVTVTLEQTATLRAEVVFEGTSALRQAVRFVALQADGGGVFGSAQSASAIGTNANRAIATLTGIAAGRYWIDAASGLNPAGPVSNWTPKSITIAGRDMQNRWLDVSPGQEINDIVITMSDQPTEITGSVTFASSAASPRSVVLFASDSKLWLPGTNRVRVAAVSPDGRYTFRAVNPGDYRLAATPSTGLPTAVQIPAFLNKLLPVSVPISMKIGERRTVELVAK